MNIFLIYYIIFFVIDVIKQLSMYCIFSTFNPCRRLETVSQSPAHPEEPRPFQVSTTGGPDTLTIAGLFLGLNVVGGVSRRIQRVPSI